MQRSLDVPVLCRVLPLAPAQRFAKHPLQCFDITDYNKSGFFCLHDCLTQRQTHRRLDRPSEWRVDRTTVSWANDTTWQPGSQEWRGMSMAFISLCSGIASAVYHMSTCSLTSLLIMSFKRCRLPQHLFLCTTRVGVCCECAWMWCVSVCHLHANLFRAASTWPSPGCDGD